MNANRWERAKTIFHKAADLDETERAAYLHEACGNDTTLRAEVDRLLKSDAQTSPFLQTPIPGMALALWSEWNDATGEMVGAYRLTRLLDTGGMGAVYEAKRVDGEIQQRVAIKIIREGAADDEVIRRFAHERQVLASLEHPCIARLLDAGTLKTGLPYLIMEYVEGQTVDCFCDDRKLTVAERLRLFLQVCDAVQYAHTRLVVHRDLKPGNVLVADRGSPKLVDFGISKVLGKNSPATAHGKQLMTPQYASPEQLRGEPPSTASDVYSLGVILHELLTGEHPHRQHRHGFQKSIGDNAPVTPSRVVLESSTTTQSGRDSGDSAAWFSRGTTQRGLTSQLRGDLDNIVLTAVHEDAARRYTAVEHLASDIRNYLEGRPVRARRDSLGYCLNKFILRNKALTATGILAMLLFVTSVAAVTIGYLRTSEALQRAQDANEVAEAEAVRARLATKKAEMVSEFMMRLLRSSDPGFEGTTVGPDQPIRDVLLAAVDRIDTELADHPDVRAALHLQAGRALRNLGMVEEAIEGFERVLAITEDLHGRIHFRTAECLADLASTCLQAGDYDRAERLAEESVAINEAYFEDTPSHWFASALSVLGRVKVRVGKHTEAKQAMSRALDMCIQTGEPDSCYMTDLLNSYGGVLIGLGEWSEAEAVYRKCLDIEKETLGFHHPNVTNTLGGLATALGQNRRYAEAAEIQRQVLTRRIDELGEEHPAVATSMQNSAALLLKYEGDPSEAEQLARRAVAIRIKSLPPGHPRIATATVVLAATLLQKGDFAGSERLIREAIGVYERRPGRPYAHSLALCTLGRLLTYQGRLDEAEEVLDRTADIQDRLLSEKHPIREWTYQAVAALKLARMDYGAAESLIRKAIAFSLAAYDRENTAHASSYALLGTILTRAGKLEEAEAVLAKCMRIRQRDVRPNHQTVARTMVAICERQLAAGELQLAEQNCREAIAIIAQTTSSGHPFLAEPHSLLGRIMLQAGRHPEAEGHLRHSIQIAREHLDPHHPLLATTLETLARILHLTNRRDDAEKLMHEVVTIRDNVFGEQHLSTIQACQTLGEYSTR